MPNSLINNVLGASAAVTSFLVMAFTGLRLRGTAQPAPSAFSHRLLTLAYACLVLLLGTGSDLGKWLRDALFALVNRIASISLSYKHLQQSLNAHGYARSALVPLSITLVCTILPSSTYACQFDPLLDTEARKAGLPPAVIVAMVHAESSGHPGSTGDGGKARGLFQITEPTWRRYSTQPFSQAYEPRENIRVGIAHLKAAKTTDPRNLVSWHNAGVKDWRRLQPRWSIHHPNRMYRAIYRGAQP